MALSLVTFKYNQQDSFFIITLVFKNDVLIHVYVYAKTWFESYLCVNVEPYDWQIDLALDFVRLLLNSVDGEKVEVVEE